MKEEAQDGDRLGTIDELSGLLFVAQEMGRRLANETHEEAYDSVRELNELLHHSRTKLELIKKS
ncbi:MAG: hypothetical protein PHP85_08800 [Gallionella sp.]|nr:hypothetical protein [Gallionella sp.]